MKLTSIFFTVAAVFAGPLFAQESPNQYPSKPVMIIVPLSSGGAGDVEARLYCQKFSENLGRPCLVDYKPGAGTTVGTAFVVKSKPDGYTLIASSPSLTLAPAFYKELSYDVTRDLTPITQMSNRATLVVVNSAFPASNMTEFVSYMKANPGKLNWGSVGVGGVTHLLGVWLQNLTGTKLSVVQYKGSGAMNVDLVAGRIDASAYTFISATPLLKAGKIRAIGLSSAERSPLLPDMPTVQEQGIPDFEYPSWLSILGPAGMQPGLIAKLHAELVKVAKSPEVTKVLASSGTVAVGSTPEQLRKLIATETARWRQVVRDGDIKLEE